MSKGILADHATEVAKFIFYTRRLNWKMLRIYLDERLTDTETHTQKTQKRIDL